MFGRTPLRLPVAEIFAAAARDPHAEALPHKRRGVWQSWSRGDLIAQVERLGQALQTRGIGPQSLVVVSGEYAPNLLLFALAAARQAARVVTAPTSVHRMALADWLERGRPDLVFLGLRDQLGTWRAALGDTGQSAAIVVDFHLPWGHPSNAGFSFAADLLGVADQGATSARPSPDVLWTEEGTDWAEGFAYLLHAAASGRALAFPESRIAAARDRRETQPAAMALSPQHHAALSQDLSARLPTGGTFAASLVRLAMNAGRRQHVSWQHRWLLHRLRRPCGLARLRELTVVAADGHPDTTDTASDLFAALGTTSGFTRPPAVAPAAQPEMAYA